MSAECFVGRASELAELEALLAGAAAGSGNAVLVEGEHGIGKTALLQRALAGAASAGCALAWASADELGQRLPLWLMTEGLRARSGLVAVEGGRQAGDGLRGGNGTARRPAAARGPAAARPASVRLAAAAGSAPPDDPEAAQVKRLLAQVERWCAASPVVLVVEDLQWADDASLRVCQRLARAVGHMPLLLIGSLRPGPMSDELDRLRRGLNSCGGTVISLGPLAGPELSELVMRLSGGLPGREVSGLVRGAGGNPLYARELVRSVSEDNPQRVTEGQQAQASRGVPASLAGAIGRRLSALPQETTGVLRWAAILGQEFTVTDLAEVTGRTAGELIEVVREAVTTGLIEEAGRSAAAAGGATAGPGPRLAFRHGLVRQVLYDDMPGALSAALHLQAARALASAGAAAERVAIHLAAVPESADEWVREWLADTAPVLVYRAPQVSAQVLRHALNRMPDADERREVLEAALVTAAFLLFRDEEVERAGGRLLAYARDRDRAADAAWRVGYALMRTGRPGEAVAAVDRALRQRALSVAWTARLQALRAFAMTTAGQDDASDAARNALALAKEADDRFAAGYALYALALADFRRRQKAVALGHIDAALDVIGDEPHTTDLRLLLLTHQARALDQLDRRAEADTAIQTGLELAERTGSPRMAMVCSIAAEKYFHQGHWDDALAVLEQADLLASPSCDLIRARGLKALIACHRDDWGTATGHITAVPDPEASSAFHRASWHFLLLAQALTAEQAGNLGEAVAVLTVSLDPAFGRDTTYRFLLLPVLARLALAADDAATARAAAAEAAREAEREPLLVTTAAASACRGLVDADPGRLLAAAASYESPCRPLERAQLLEEAAVLLASRGDLHPARRAAGDAVGLYRGLGASWDIRRVTNRLRAYGIRPASRRRRAGQPSTGWQALTPTEIKIASLIARGRSNPDIAAELWLSRNTVQTHVSHILAKLGVRSRVEIVLEVLQQPMAGEQSQDRLTA
jgi:DNA-binding CsgD family transcriptional regulator/tetratricopeptide (TPR) repeat protein